MNFEYEEHEQLLADNVRRYLRQHYDFEARKAFLASARGFSDDAWAVYADMGVLALTVPEACGGFGAGAVALSAVIECLGETLALEPLLSTLGLGARLIARGGMPEQKARVLPGIAEGRLRLALAHGENGARYDLAHVATRAQASGGRWLLEGTKRVVLDAPSADLLIVSARTHGAVANAQGISLFIVDPAATGVRMQPYRTVDGRRAADVVLERAVVTADDLIGPEGDALALLEDAVDFATALMCAEAVGAMQDANAATLEFLKTRRQFGVPIGSFQVLQHRMVDMTIAAEQARSMACLACASVDSAPDARERARVVSAAKVLIAQSCRQVSQQSVQLHGGMGLTEEPKISHTFRRLTTIAQQFGDEDHHLERFAAVSPDAAAVPKFFAEAGVEGRA